MNQILFKKSDPNLSLESESLLQNQLKSLPECQNPGKVVKIDFLNVDLIKNRQIRL